MEGDSGMRVCAGQVTSSDTVNCSHITSVLRQPTHNRPDNKGENPNQQEASSRIKLHPECCWEKLRTASDPKKNGPGIQFLAGNVSWSPF